MSGIVRFLLNPVLDHSELFVRSKNGFLRSPNYDVMIKETVISFKL